MVMWTMLGWAMLGSACSMGDGGPGSMTIDGRVGTINTARAGLQHLVARTITHVMAVDPETASPRRSLAAIPSDGTFSLTVEAKRPYVIVFIDSSAVGVDMVVAVFRAGTLDTIPPSSPGSCPWQTSRSTR